MTTLPEVNSLDDLKGATEPVNVTGDVNLSSLKLARLPVKFGEVGGSFDCYRNQLTSLVGIHKIIKSCKGINLYDNPIKEGGLGLLLIKDLKYIQYNLPAFQIIEKYLGKGKRGMIDCQTELIKAGFKDFAKL